jgi:2-desacetyl-2-hydroxyethyl bacteriochlorophyllide A dehydrogenase
MKAVILDAVNKIALKEVDRDKVGADEALIRVEAAGICGSDRHILHGTYPANYPVILGHEFSGIIESLPVGSNFKVGDRVNVNPNIACRVCKYCESGQVNLCESNIAHGVNRNGGLAEYAVVPISQLFSLPKTLPISHGALCEPIACCIQGIDLAEIKPGDSVAIIGGGIIGQLMVQLAKLAGASVVLLSTRQKFRRDMALSLGATHTLDPSVEHSNSRYNGLSGVAPGGFDVVVECAGTSETLQQSLDIVRKGGTVILFGVMPQGEKFEIIPFDIFVRQVRIQGVFTGSTVHGRAAEMVASGKLQLEQLITHVVELRKIPELLLGNPLPGEVKTIVLPS